MNRSLKAKLILSYLAVALLTVLVVSALIRLTSGRSLMNLVMDQQTALLHTSVKEYYAANGSMDGYFVFYLQSSRRDFPPPQPEGSYDKPLEMRVPRGLYGLVDTEYRAVLPTMGIDVGQVIPQDKIKKKIAVEVDGKTIAWILPDTSLEFKLSAEEELFLKRSTLAIVLAAVVGVILAVVMGALLASRLIKPIRRLTDASRSLAKGNLEQQLPVTSQDELGQLTETFNQMSADLASADVQRKRMTADISHDLSTPLQIISGYIDMLEGSEVTLSPQRIEIIKTEIEHLRRLVGDLTTLAQAEGGGMDLQLQPVAPSLLLERVCAAYEPIAARQGVYINVVVLEELPQILVDEGRSMQVLKNLVENALRYTPSGGYITLSALADKQVHISVTDTGSGIAPEDLPFVFDRFYRADKAREGNSGKMGLGLSICHVLVTAQGGVISAHSDGRDKGSTFTISFDRADSETLAQ